MPNNALKILEKKVSIPSLFYLGKQKRVINNFLSRYHNELILNIGSGETDYASKVINLDVDVMQGVNVIGDAQCLPFADNSFAAVMSESAFEHIIDPNQVVREIKRILRPGGEFLVILAFLTPYHPASGTEADYIRYTIPGIKHLFKSFETLEVGPMVGPASTFCLVTRTLLSSVLSFRNKLLYDLWGIFFKCILFPIKYLDIILLKNQFSHIAACDLYCIGRKKD